LKKVSIIIVSHDSGTYLLQTLDSLSGAEQKEDVEIIVVDNASRDGSVAEVKRRHPGVLVLALDRNVGFAAANNRGAEKASGDYLLFLNSDTLVPQGTLEKLLDVKERHPEWGVVAPLIRYPDGSLQVSWGMDLHLYTEFFMKHFSVAWNRRRFRKKDGKTARMVDWASGACFLTARSLFEKVGGFDEEYFLYVEDADLCRRIRKLGYGVAVTAEAHIVHHRGGSVSRYPDRLLPEAKKSQLTYYKKHNLRISLVLLKSYLILRFVFRRLWCRWRGDVRGEETSRRTLSVVRGFR